MNLIVTSKKAILNIRNTFSEIRHNKWTWNTFTDLKK